MFAPYLAVVHAARERRQPGQMAKLTCAKQEQSRVQWCNSGIIVGASRSMLSAIKRHAIGPGCRLIGMTHRHLLDLHSCIWQYRYKDWLRIAWAVWFVKHHRNRQ